MYSKILKDTAASSKAWLSRARGTKDLPWVKSAGNLFSRIGTPDGGFTYSPKLNSEPKEGFALSPYPEHSFAKDAKDLKADDVVDYILSKANMLRDPKNHVGAWHDPETGRVYMDISVVVKSHKEAEALCKKHDQIAYFDIKSMKSVVVDQNATSGGVSKGENMATKKSEVALVSGDGVMTIEGMERIYKTLSGKNFTDAERAAAQKKLDAHLEKEKKAQ